MYLRRNTVIEDGDGAIGLAARVVLKDGSSARPHLKCALFPPQAPYDLTGHAVDLVDGGGLAGGDYQVAVVVYVYGVDVEVVKGFLGSIRLGVGLVEADVL